MNPLDKYEKIKTVGKGAFGIAVLYRKKSTNQLVVIKEINTVDLSSDEHQMALNEVEVLSSLHHPHIIGYGGSFVVQGVLMIEMEYADSGTLSQMLSRRKNYIPEREVIEYLRQISSAISYMHGNNILHRDLKTANVFMTSDNCLKIGDFGISKVLTTNAQAQTVLGTPYYISPEMCEGKEYDEKSDIWAMGCILYEMCSLHRTFQASSLSALVNKIVQGNYKPIPSGYSKALSNLIDELLNKNPERRPTAKEIYNTKISLILTSLGSGGYNYVGTNEIFERSVLYEMKYLKNKIDIQPIAVPVNIKIVQLSTGSDHYIAVSEEGEVYAWGEGSKGQLGLGKYKKYSEDPVQITSLYNQKVVMSAAGRRFSIFLTIDGAVFSCGEGLNGILGHGDWINYFEATPIDTFSDIPIKKISSSTNHVVALAINGDLYTWGSGKKGQTGQGTLLNTCTPTKVSIHSKYEIKSIHTGFDSNMLITNKGVFLACGWNNENKLSIGKSIEFVIQFTEISGIPGKLINCSIGKSHCAIITLLKNGMSAVYTTGSFGMQSSSSKPKRISSLDNIKITLIECGPSYTVIGTEYNSILFFGMRYELSETVNDSDISQNSSGIWSQKSNSQESITDFTSTKTYIPKIITQPVTLLGLYVSSSQIDNGSFITLKGIYPMAFKMVFLITTNVPMAMSKVEKKYTETNGNAIQDQDSIPNWIKEDIAVSKYTWLEK